MYIPKANEEKRVPVMHRLMADHPLASLVTGGPDGLVATHLPLTLDPDGTEFGVLRGHIARANPQVRGGPGEGEALAIFAGPQHYISPAWYPDKQMHGREVPTWNYVVVHAYGPLRVVEDAAWLRAHLDVLTDIHEAGSEAPWSVADAPEAFVAAQIRGIVGVEIAVRRLEGKWKVSQNRNAVDRDGVLRGLAALNTPESRTMQALISGDSCPVGMPGKL